MNVGDKVTYTSKHKYNETEYIQIRTGTIWDFHTDGKSAWVDFGTGGYLRCLLSKLRIAKQQ